MCHVDSCNGRSSITLKFLSMKNIWPTIFLELSMLVSIITMDYLSVSYVFCGLLSTIAVYINHQRNKTKVHVYE